MEALAPFISSKGLSLIASSLCLSFITFLVLLLKNVIKNKITSPTSLMLTSSFCAGMALVNFGMHSIPNILDLKTDLHCPVPEPRNCASSSSEIIPCNSKTLWLINTHSPVVIGIYFSAIIFYMFKMFHVHVQSSIWSTNLFFALDSLFESFILISGIKYDAATKTFNFSHFATGLIAISFHKFIEVFTMTGGISESPITSRILFSLLPVISIVIGIFLTSYFELSSDVKYWANIVMSSLSTGFFAFLAYDLTVDALDLHLDAPQHSVAVCANSNHHHHHHDFSFALIFTLPFWKKNIFRVLQIAIFSGISYALFLLIDTFTSTPGHSHCHHH